MGQRLHEEPSPVFNGHSPCAKTYEPHRWNDLSAGEFCTCDLQTETRVQCRNNCYNYACDIQNNTFARPGSGGNAPFPSPYNPITGTGGYSCNDLTAAASADGLVPVRQDQGCPQCCFKVALVLRLYDPSNPESGIDFHWYRHDNNGTWSHKIGKTSATNQDASGNMIDDPEQADRGGYNQFCSYFCVCKSRVTIR